MGADPAGTKALVGKGWRTPPLGRGEGCVLGGQGGREGTLRAVREEPQLSQSLRQGSWAGAEEA